MNTLKQNGIDTTGFFDLSMRVPFGAEVKILVNGKEMSVGNNGFVTSNVDFDGNVGFLDAGNGIAFGTVPNFESDLAEDPIVQNIMREGWVFNSRTDGRWVCAKTFSMLNGETYNPKLRCWERGFDAYLRNGYGFMYQFTMMLDEVHKLAKMERSNDPDFGRLSRFFTKAVVYQTCKHYIRQLKKFVAKQPTRKHQGRPYVKLNRYGNVHVDELNVKVYNPLESALSKINSCNNYTELEKALRDFNRLICKLPYETPKCPAFKDAFKGKGAFMTLNNIVKHHGVTLTNYETGEALNTYESVDYVESLLDTYRGSYWKFHELLKATIALNNFDLRESIRSQREN